MAAPRREKSNSTSPAVADGVGSDAAVDARDAMANGFDHPGAMAKALGIIEAVAARGEPTTIADLIRCTGLTEPTAHRITTTLCEMGFVERDTVRGGFVEGPRLLKLAMDTLRSAAPRTVRHAILRSVSDLVGETCNFGVLAGAEVIYLDRVEAKWPLGLRFEAGSHVPAHCTAIGKLLLSLRSPDERAAMIAAMPLTRYTSRTLTDASQLLHALEQSAQSKVGIDDQEFIDGVVCVSVPVFASGDGSGVAQVIGGIAVSAPEARISIENATNFIPIMRTAAERLGATFSLR
jgi:DNA-binding IclR family transcriptional regulator